MAVATLLGNSLRQTVHTLRASVTCRLTAKEPGSVPQIRSVIEYGLPISFLSRRSAGWWRSTVVERRSLAGELSLSCARPAADG